ncbi:hypothetical protein [uncultured Clostridium sp.]|jgi:hypothetical protein|uniref:hypothetical protein n=1 Tax=uncultured Clostridium sp. TaxID=59620 RepID=UPI002607D714|nr:hypothetical protein [uncultured Clostridium sp.]
MKKLNNLFIALLVAIAIFLSLNITNVHATQTSHQVLYTTNNFNIHGEHMNFIINSISSSTDNLIIDGYLLNLDKINLKEIKDFHLKITDAKNAKIIDEVFLDLQLETPLSGQSGVRIVLTSPLKGKKLDKKDFSKINYNFSYNYLES